MKESVTKENKQPHYVSTSEVNKLLSQALRAICLTRDYVGETKLPALNGWEWYEAGKKLADHLDDDVWSIEFKKRVNIDKSHEVRKAFKVGDWVSSHVHQGCSAVFEGIYCDYQPFSYLDDYDSKNFKHATPEEIENAKRIS